MSAWWDYVVRIAGTNVQKAIATKSGISETAFSRWKQGKNLPPEAVTVIVFARSYDRPPVEALVAAGYLWENEAADAITIQPSSAALSDDELLAELADRLAERHAHGLGGQELAQGNYVGGRVRESLMNGGGHVGDGFKGARESG